MTKRLNGYFVVVDPVPPTAEQMHAFNEAWLRAGGEIGELLGINIIPDKPPIILRDEPVKPTARPLPYPPRLKGRYAR